MTRRYIVRVQNRGWFKKGHPLVGSPTYKSWQSMLERVRKRPGYADRGITVCDRWRNFAAFVEDMGERPAGRTLDRIDNDGNYEPANCRWATASEQSRNRRRRAPETYRRGPVKTHCKRGHPRDQWRGKQCRLCLNQLQNERRRRESEEACAAW